MVNTLPQGLTIPPLENGDRLHRVEFERRYQAMPKQTKAELVEGVVYMASPVRSQSHGQPHAAIMAWLGAYWAATPGTDLNDNATVRLDADNEPQPDACLRLETSAGEQSRLSDDDYIEGAPELVVEIAASSAALDLHTKKTIYRRNGVQEYIVWQVLDHKLDWFWLTAGDYLSLTADDAGLIKSQVFPGLWLACEDLVNKNLQSVLATVQAGTGSREHAAFLAKLAAYQ
ncbi:MAG: Uma2 family endonuclease [Leptolyngbya sp. RL_3_1]|nr:Uma2 family endonuclease [Leptolyngbya sp. RL_3_1]